MYSVTTTSGSNTFTVTAGPSTKLEPGDAIWSDAFPFGSVVSGVSGSAGAQTVTVTDVFGSENPQNATVTHTSGSGRHVENSNRHGAARELQHARKHLSRVAGRAEDGLFRGLHAFAGSRLHAEL